MGYSSHVRGLGDLQPMMRVEVTCWQCGHCRELDPQKLAEKLGPEYPVRWLPRRLRCRRCNERNVRVRVVYKYVILDTGAPP